MRLRTLLTVQANSNATLRSSCLAVTDEVRTVHPLSLGKVQDVKVSGPESHQTVDLFWNVLHVDCDASYT